MRLLMRRSTTLLSFIVSQTAPFIILLQAFRNINCSDFFNKQLIKSFDYFYFQDISIGVSLNFVLPQGVCFMLKFKYNKCCDFHIGISLSSF